MLRSYPQCEERFRRAGIWVWVLFVLLLLPVGSWGVVWGQGLSSAVKSATGGSPPPADATAAPVVAPPPPVPADPLGRTSPHGTVLGFLRAAEEKDYTKAAKFLDGKRSPEQATELVVQLKYLLDQGLSTSLDDISRSPQKDIEDEHRVTRERIGLLKTPDGEMEVLLDLVKRPGEASIWLFSQETLDRVPEAYSSEHRKDIEDYFPAWSQNIRFLSVPLWRWGTILVYLLMVFLAASLITRAMIWLFRRLFKNRVTASVEESVLALKAPIFCVLGAIMNRAAAGYARTALSRHYWSVVGLILLWVSGAWLLVRITNILVSVWRHRLLLKMQVERATLVSLLGRIFTILVGLVLVLVLLAQAGVNVSAMVAGLGIGGVALALAAQKTLADLFGGLSIVMRGAVRVGDFCQIDGLTGTVEDIGTSSLSLRTLGRSVVSIPNSKVAEVNLENFAMRDQFWLNQTFTLRFDTPHAVVREVLEKIVQLLLAHPEFNKNSARARLINLTPSGPQIEVFAYFRRPGADWAVFLGEQEKIMLQILTIVEEAGSSLAAPIGVVRMEKEKA
ncbi:MscS family membrane protein [Edaphobacter aggregans]|uniref:MscS family membrane protein n=1 Tax=Edaphobacter aggregans TaxID=570835 RepID=A0A428MLP3_9BACT|nr:MscS family membrane protein [Edaphobacter aggregans]